VRVTGDAPAGSYPHVEFFLLERAKEARLPVPDADIVRHHLVGLFESYFTLQVGLARIVNEKMILD